MAVLSGVAMIPRRWRSSSALAIRKRGGRKLVLVPAGIATAPDRSRVDSAMIKALARAFRWRKLLETGAHGTIEELGAAEKINSSYVSRVLRLTLLAPTSSRRYSTGRIRSS